MSEKKPTNTDRIKALEEKVEELQQCLSKLNLLDAPSSPKTPTRSPDSSFVGSLPTTSPLRSNKSTPNGKKANSFVSRVQEMKNWFQEQNFLREHGKCTCTKDCECNGFGLKGAGKTSTVNCPCILSGHLCRKDCECNFNLLYKNEWGHDAHFCGSCSKTLSSMK
eukprot:m.134478 g.134478  ORF g.134478 m.134478 type:complete len:165 (-) comp9612_c0_seq1:545-1039(-)